MHVLTQSRALELLKDEAEKALALRAGTASVGTTSTLVACPSRSLHFIVHICKEALAAEAAFEP